MITPKQFTNGQCVLIDGEMFQVLFTQHKRTAQRSAVVRTKLRNVKTGAISETNLDPDATYEEAFIEKKTMQYLYNDGQTYHFMDQRSYEQYEIPKDFIGESAQFLKDNTDVSIGFYNKKPIGVELPVTIELKVTYTEPGIRGDTAKGGFKPANVETGATVKVPLFVKEGDVIKIDTRTGEYIARV